MYPQLIVCAGLGDGSSIGGIVSVSAWWFSVSLYTHSDLSMHPGACTVQKGKPVVFFNLLGKQFGLTDLRWLWNPSSLSFFKQVVELVALLNIFLAKNH